MNELIFVLFYTSIDTFRVVYIILILVISIFLGMEQLVNGEKRN
jgi:hypothetical protein